jgi:hypothetical protein
LNEQQQILVQRLKEGELSLNRFLEVKLDKSPKELKGYMEHLRTPEELEKAGIVNWGLAATPDDFLIVIDCDKQGLYDRLSEVLPETFEVTSTRRKLPHKYFVVCGPQVPNRIFALPGDINEKGQANGAGELRANNYYVVAPGSTVDFTDSKTGEHVKGMYLISRNVPIARMEYPDFMKAIEPYLKDASGKGDIITTEEMKTGVGEGYRHFKTMSYAYHLIAKARLGEAVALQELSRFGKACTPPLEDTEYFKRAINAAIRWEAKAIKKPKESLEQATERVRQGVELRIIDDLIKSEEEKQKNAETPLQPLTDDELKEILGATVKHDDSNKVITFLTMLCTYTDEDQTNLGYLAESSSGKSYIPLELSCYFPEHDVIPLGYCSPTAFFHEWGILIPDPSDNREVEDDKKHKIRLVNLEKNLLIFLDQPHAKLLENLRPLLSHDKKEIRLKITNKSEKSGQRSENILVRGYPTVVFCTANYRQNEQEKTRLLLLSPEHTQEKLREAILLKIEKESDRENFAKILAANPQRQALIRRVRAIKQALINQITIPEELRATIYQNFMENRKFLQSRNSRDISRLLSIIKGNALLNYQQRSPIENEETGSTNITANLEDVEIGFKYYNTVSEANELGIPPEIYEVYQTFQKEMEEYINGFSRKDFQKMYFDTYHRYIGREKAKAFIEGLETAGLLIEQQDPIDKRTLRYVCEGGGVASPTKEEIQRKIQECHKKFCLKKNTPHPSPTHISSQSQLQKRLCSQECKNFRQAACPVDNYGYRPTDAEIPLRCPGYEQAQAGEDS